MAVIIELFPTRSNVPALIDPELSEAFERLFILIACCLCTSFMRHNVLDIPVQRYVREMASEMQSEMHRFDVKTVNEIINSKPAVRTIADSFINTMIQNGNLPQGYQLD